MTGEEKMVRENVHQNNPDRNRANNKLYGIATIDKRGVMRNVLRKSLGCVKIGHAAWTMVIEEEVASKIRKCKYCFKG
jgi:hypothetical protein